MFSLYTWLYLEQGTALRALPGSDIFVRMADMGSGLFLYGGILPADPALFYCFAELPQWLRLVLLSGTAGRSPVKWSFSLLPSFLYGFSEIFGLNIFHLYKSWNVTFCPLNMYFPLFSSRTKTAKASNQSLTSWTLITMKLHYLRAITI